MSRAAGALFGALVLATGAAFLVTQRLKQAPRLVKTLTVTQLISPHVAFERASIRVRLTQPDQVTISVVSADGDVVRGLLAGREAGTVRPLDLLWDARDDRGRVVPDGDYSVRVGLRRQGRSVVLLDEITVDGTPPRPVVRVRRPSDTTGPVIFPQRGGGWVRFTVSGTRPRTERLFVFRTDLPRPRLVSRLPRRPAPEAPGAWNGRIGRSPAPPGTYAVVARDTDEAGNSGYSFPLGPRVAPGRNDPPGGAGVTVRPLASQAPQVPTAAGRKFTVFVEARGREYRWRLHRYGQRRTIARGRRRNPALRLTAPRGPSGLYVVELASGPSRSAAFVAVQGPGRHRVLVVVPLISWQGRNRVDDDGDGQVDTLDVDGRARLDRPLAGGGVPVGFAAAEGPMLRLLDRPQQRYSLTTDVGLSGAGAERTLRAHRGVVLLGDPRWLPPRAANALRGFVERGGRVLSLGTDSLRRSVRLDGRALSRPSRRAAADVFGATIAPVARRRVELLGAADRIGLFAGGDGRFTGFTAFEETLAPGPEAQVVAQAEEQGARAGAPVIVAVRIGRGLVIRTGLPQWEQRLGNPNVSTMTKRAWTLLSR